MIVDASKGFIKDGKNNKLRASDIKQISDTVINRENIEGYSRVVNREEIRANDYNLNIPRYVDSSENTESWDIYASMFGGIPINELDDLKDYWIAFPELRNALFTKEDIPYVELITQDISSTIREHSDIKKFKENFATAFDNFSDYLKSELLEKTKDIVIAKEENILSENIFKRLKSIPLIDKYEAYQFLHEEWEKISVDIEVLQTEGFEAAKKVDPNLITKKKDGKDEEVQEGWNGHIIPFYLVQKVFLVNESNAVKEKENRLAEIPSEYEEIIESMTEEEKDTEVLNEANDAFISKEVSKKLKELKLEEKTQEVVAFISKLEVVERLQREEKELKTKIKNEVVKLQMITKEKIEKLSDEEVYILLEKKWIDPLITSLHKLPDRIIDELIDKIQAIKKKYETTYFEIEEQIRETKQLLCSMIDEIEGNEFDMKGLSEFKSLLLGE